LELLGLLTTGGDEMVALGLLTNRRGGESGAGADVILEIPALDRAPVHPKGMAPAYALGDEGP